MPVARYRRWSLAMPVPVVNVKETDVENLLEDSKFKNCVGTTSLSASVAFHDDSNQSPPLINNLILKLNNHEVAHLYFFS